MCDALVRSKLLGDKLKKRWRALVAAWSKK
jgi:hypothetical protein